MPRCDSRRLDADRLEDGRRDVGDVVVLVADGAAVLDARRPVDDHRVADAAAVGVLLVALEGRVAGLRPTGRVVVVVQRPAQLVDVLQHVLDAQVDVAAGDGVEVDLLGLADWAALLAGAVVRDQHDQRVLELADLLQEVQASARCGCRCGPGTPRTPPASARRGAARCR